ncbi:ABC transporter permease subunit [Paludisphaera sp.]|uniref:ABC transporter permease n=1 Tax=Paludisphaera sp. TaxID=2017432 RepID=UPI00301DD175
MATILAEPSAPTPAHVDPDGAERGRGLSSPAWAPAPAVAAALTLALHLALPDRQPPSSGRMFVGLMAAMLAGSLAMAALRRTSGKLGAWARYRSPLAAGIILTLAAWDLLTLKLAWLPMPYFPDPERVLGAMWEDRDALGLSAFHSLRLLACGYAAGAAAGLACGIVIGWSRSARYWGMPLLKLVGPIPATAYVPLAMVMFPDAFASGVALIAVAVWFPVTMLTCSGVADVPAAYLDVARTLGAGRAHLIFRVALPSALPSVFLGLFMGMGAAFLTLIVAETLGVSSGLGWYLKWKQGYLEYPHVYAALVIMSLFFSGLMTLLFKARDRAMGWQKGAIRW